MRQEPERVTVAAGEGFVSRAQTSQTKPGPNIAPAISSMVMRRDSMLPKERSRLSLRVGILSSRCGAVDSPEKK